MTGSPAAALSGARLYAILDLGYTPEDRAADVTSALLAGGADILQLRAKNHSPDTIRRVAETIAPQCREAGIPFIVNDFPDLAAEVGADGVHLGQDDGPLAAAREIVGTGKWIGRSTHSLAQAVAALAEGADYIGFGPLFPTPTKAGRAAIGLESVAEMENQVGRHLPAFCIGGVNEATLPAVIAAGARRAVVVSALLQAPDISAATRAARGLLVKGRPE